MKPPRPSARFDRLLDIGSRCAAAYDSWTTLMEVPSDQRRIRLLDDALLKAVKLILGFFALPFSVGLLERLDRRTRMAYLLFGLLNAAISARALWDLSHIDRTYAKARARWNRSRRRSRSNPETSGIYRLGVAMVALAGAVTRRHREAPLSSKPHGGLIAAAEVYVNLAVILLVIGRRLHVVPTAGKVAPGKRYLVVTALSHLFSSATFAAMGLHNAMVSDEEQARRRADFELFRAKYMGGTGPASGASLGGATRSYPGAVVRLTVSQSAKA